MLAFDCAGLPAKLCYDLSRVTYDLYVINTATVSAVNLASCCCQDSIGFAGSQKADATGLGYDTLIVGVTSMRESGVCQHEN